MYMTCFDLSSCHQKMDLLMSQSLVRPRRDIINKLIHGLMNMSPPAEDLWTRQLEKKQQLCASGTYPIFIYFGLQLLIKIMNTLLLLRR